MATMYQASVNRTDVVRVCLKWIKDREARIEKKREELIQVEMDKKRWFGLARKYTRDEAIESLKKERGLTFYSKWDEVAQTGLYWYEVCVDVMAACNSKSVTDVILRDESLDFVMNLLCTENQNA